MRRCLLFLLSLALIVGAAPSGLSTPRPARADGFIDFEDGVDGQPIKSTIPGLQFSTTEGYDWVYADWRTGKYNGPYPDGAYYSHGSFFAWLGPRQGAGRIDFTEGCATYLQVWVSSAQGLIADAHTSSGARVATASVPGNTGTGKMARLRVEAPARQCFSYVILHDTGDYWLIDDLSTDAKGVPTARPPVIILPGLTGSRLKNHDTCKNELSEVWPAAGKMLLDPFDKHLDHLKLTKNSEASASSCDHISPDGIIRNVSVLQFYGPLIDHLKGKDFDVFSFDYDWRLDLRDTADKLDAFVDNVRNQTGASQVSFVDHSLGGLLARYYVTSHTDRAAKVDQVISLGTPFLGAPKSLKVLRWGDKGWKTFDWLEIGPSYAPRVRDLSQNSPAMYQILPTRRYFDVYGGSCYRVDGTMQSWGQTRATYMRHNSILTPEAESFHSSAMDDWSSSPPDVAFRLIVGSGLNTPGVLHENSVRNWRGDAETRIDLEPTDGDGTVPLHSADLKGNGHDYSGGVPIWYTGRDVNHHGLITKQYVQDFVAALLATPPNAQAMRRARASARPPDPSAPVLYRGPLGRFPEPANRATAPPIPPEMSLKPTELDGGQIAAYGAIALHVYDESGNHTGPTEDGRVELGIPGSDYITAENAVFIGVPSGRTYDVKAESEGTADFDLRVRNVKGVDTDLIKRTISYTGAPIGSQGSAKLIYKPHDAGSAPHMVVDEDGDGDYEGSVPPTGDVGPEESYDFVAPTVTIGLEGAVGADGCYLGKVKVTITASDEGSGLAKVAYTTNQGQSVQAYQGPFEVSVDTVASIVARAIDRVGNVGSAAKSLRCGKACLPLIFRGYSYAPAVPLWQPGAGIRDRVIYGLAVAPGGCNTLYAATGGGLFKSMDGGRSWVRTGLHTLLAAQPRSPNAPAFVRAPDGVAAPTLVSSVTTDPWNAQIVYATTWGKGAYKSTDGGGTWTPVNNGLADLYLYAIVADPANGQVLYAGADSRGVFKSTNGGASWFPVNTGLANPKVRSLSIDPSNGQVLYAGGDGGGVFKSIDGAGSWAPTGPLGAGDVWSIAIDRTGSQTDSRTVYAALGGGGVYKSTNGGGSWFAANRGLGSTDLRALIIDGANNRALYAGTNGAGVYASTDGGGSWQPMNAGLAEKTVKSLCQGVGCGIIHAGTKKGAWRYEP